MVQGLSLQPRLPTTCPVCLPGPPGTSLHALAGGCLQGDHSPEREACNPTGLAPGPLGAPQSLPDCEGKGTTPGQDRTGGGAPCTGRILPAYQFYQLGVLLAGRPRASDLLGLVLPVPFCAVAQRGSLALDQTSCPQTGRTSRAGRMGQEGFSTIAPRQPPPRRWDAEPFMGVGRVGGGRWSRILS